MLKAIGFNCFDKHILPFKLLVSNVNPRQRQRQYTEGSPPSDEEGGFRLLPHFNICLCVKVKEVNFVLHPTQLPAWH